MKVLVNEETSHSCLHSAECLYVLLYIGCFQSEEEVEEVEVVKEKKKTRFEPVDDLKPPGTQDEPAEEPPPKIAGPPGPPPGGPPGAPPGLPPGIMPPGN